MPDEAYSINPTRMTGAADRAMPQNAEAEKSVLNAMLLFPDALAECISDLTPNDFYIPSNRKIYETVIEMSSRGMPIDYISLSDYLKSKGELEAVGGQARLIDLFGDLNASQGWTRHAEMLRRDATLREMIIASAQITALAYDAPEDTKEVINQAERMLLSATDRELRSGYESLEDIMSSLYTELGDMVKSGKTRLGIDTGYPGIDSLLLGMRAGQMIVIGARPGVGKTAFALNLVLNAARAGASVAFFSLEMSKIEIAQRMLAIQQSQVKLGEIRAARITADKWDPLLKATEALSQLDIMIDDTPGTTMTEIRAKARRMLRGKENGIVVIDYLQLISPPPGRVRADSRATEVAEMSRGAKIMAKDLKVPVVALSQLNRGTENRTGRASKRPQLSDLRESGSIEQDADIVILLDRSMTKEEAEEGKDRPRWGVTDFIIAKNRSGPTGRIELTFIPDSTKFMEVSNRYDD